MGMLRHDLRSRTVRLLGLTILGLQITGAAAIADARGDQRPLAARPEVAALPPAEAASPVVPVPPPRHEMRDGGGESGRTKVPFDSARRRSPRDV